MTPRVWAAVSWGALACAALSSMLYCLLVRQAFRESWFYEGWIFLTQVALAGIGLVLAMAGLRKHPILSAISAFVCGYFVLIQLVL